MVYMSPPTCVEEFPEVSPRRPRAGAQNDIFNPKPKTLSPRLLFRVGCF